MAYVTSCNTVKVTDFITVRVRGVPLFAVDNMNIHLCEYTCIMFGVHACSISC